jgi:hypothetical protein
MALTPVTEGEVHELELYQASDSARQAVARSERRKARDLRLPQPAE